MGNRQLFPAKSPKDLLGEFKESGSNEPFEEIVRRYAAMVYGVCLRVTGDKHDAEDATQAVFLSLALQAKTAREIKYLGPWLQKVAHRLALDVKKSKTRRKKREEKLAEQTRHNGPSGTNGHHPAFTGGNGHGSDPADGPGSDELKTIMMEELNQLPPKYRMPLVMHYFGGLSREEMAEQLGCNPSTLGVRVHRGKAMLGTRLAKRGVALSAVALAVVLEHVVRHGAFQGAVQPVLAAGSGAVASGSAMMYAGGNGSMTAAMKVLAIVRTAAKAIAYAKLKTAVAIILVVCSITLTASGTVQKYVPQLKHFRLPIPMDFGNWVRPLLKGLMPDLRADATSPAAGTAPQPEYTLGVADSRPAPLKVDLNKLNAGGAPQLSVPMASMPVASAAAAPGVPRIAPPAAATSAEPAPQLSPLAQAMLFPSLQRNLPAPAPAAGNADSPPRDNSASNDSSATPDKPTVVASSGSGDFYLGGAGGGGGGGKPDVYVLPANSALASRNAVIGDDGFAVFRHEGGTHDIEGNLTVGRKKDSVGRYELCAGIVKARRQIIGDEGGGSFIQKKGTVNIAGQSITVGKSGIGYYEQNGGQTVVLNEVPRNADAIAAVIGKGAAAAAAAGNASAAGSGTSFSGSGSSSGGGSSSEPETAVASGNGLVIGDQLGSEGEYVLNGGNLTATPQVVGNSGQGTITHNGGTNTSSQIVIAANQGSIGKYKFSSGMLRLHTAASSTTTTTPLSDGDSFSGMPGRTTTEPPAITIGGAGDGTFNLGNTGSSGKIWEVGAPQSVVVRGEPTGDGALIGWGRVNLTGTFLQNSVVVADGYRQERTLDLSTFSQVNNTLDNPRENGTSGWFARREGRLLLPPIPVKAGDGTYTWGENPADPVIDLVNSVRMKIHGAQHDGDVTLALLSTLRDDVPALPQGHQFIGLWAFEDWELGGFDKIDIQVRYDDAMAAVLGLDENNLKLWEYDAADMTWKRLDHDESFSRDTVNRLLGATVHGSTMSFFAVSAPEPGGLTLVALGATALLRRRRRTRRSPASFLL